MNERILKLRTQAAAWVAKNHQPQDPNAYLQKEIDQRYLMYEEKFAELIIKKCISQIALIGISNFENEDISWTVETAIASIKEHFGVQK